MNGFHNAIGENDVMAYLVMMAPRLYHLHRVLKTSGSLYLHCDTTASSYLRIISDCIFGPKNFKNEIIWKRTSAHANVGKRYGVISDILFFYTKSTNYIWNTQHAAYSDEHITNSYRYIEKATGRHYASRDLTASMQRASKGQLYEWKGIKPPPSRCWSCAIEQMERYEAENLILYSKNGYPRLKVYLDSMHGVPLQNIWIDIPVIAAQSSERLGYPTQKPLALLERIIAASSNYGDIVLDPFCGCGTTVVAAQKLDRKWIGIDITPIATSLVQKRLYDSFGARNSRLLSKEDPAQSIAFDLEGLPTDLFGAKLLYDKDLSHKDFEMWAVGLIPAIPQEKKGADKGIDGFAYFHDNPKKPSKAVVQVKGGHVTANQIRDLFGVLHTEKAQLGFFICLEAPTKPMRDAALAAGYYQAPSGVGRRVEMLQIRTIEDLLEGRNFDFPLYGSNISYSQAEQMQESLTQEEMDI